MEPWQIWTWTFEFGEHPAVIVSNPERVKRKDDLIVISCSTHRAKRFPELFEVILDESDGLDWPTLCRCDLLLYSPPESSGPTPRPGDAGTPPPYRRARDSQPGVCQPLK